MLKRLLAPLVLALAVAACTTPAAVLEVTAVVPGEDAVDVSVDAVVSATFNRAVDPATLDGNFTLDQDGTPVAGTVAYNAATRTATFTPNADLDYETEYTATLASDVAIPGGVTLGEAFSWSFTTEEAPTPTDEIDGVTVTPSSPSVVAGGSVQLTATVSVVSGTPSQAVTWSSSDLAIATVSATGLVSGVAPGTATITATSVFDDDFFGTAVVTVTAAPIPDVIDGVTVSPGTANLGVSATTTVQLDAVVSVVSGTPSEAVVWESSNTGVATVDADGLVTAVALGTATITATSVFDDDFSDSAVVTVYDLQFAAEADYAAYSGDANVNVPVSLAFPAITGGLAPFTYEITDGALPPAFVTVEYLEQTSGTLFPSVSYEIDLDPLTGEIAGATGYPGAFTGTVTVTDALGATLEADFSLTFELSLVYLDVDLVDPETDFFFVRTIDGGPATPNVAITGDRVRIAGLNTGTLPDDGSLDLLFELVCVSARFYSTGNLAASCGTSVVINVGDGTISRQATSTLGTWTFDVTVTHAASGTSDVYRINLTATTYTGTVGP